MADDPLSKVFTALADPIRREILARLRDGDATVAELAARFPVSQPAVSKHLKVLEAAGLITRERRATARLSHLEAAPMRDAVDWMAGYRAYWTESHERLDELLTDLQSPERGGTRAGGVTDVERQQGRPADTELDTEPLTEHHTEHPEDPS